MTDFRLKSVRYVSFNTILGCLWHHRPSNIQAEVGESLHVRIGSVKRQPVSYVSLSNIDCRGIGPPMPNNVDAVHVVKMGMGKVNGVEPAPNFALALCPI